MKRWIPTFSGREARLALVRQWGLPNACPREGESPFSARCRELFVDDDNDGAPVAYWIPGPEVERLLPDASDTDQAPTAGPFQEELWD